MAGPDTPDVILSFVDALTRFTRGWRYYLLTDARGLVHTRIAAFGETCAFHIACECEHEFVSTVIETRPALADESIHYYESPCPKRPDVGKFIEDKQAFPLKGSRRFYPCPECGGKGDLKCPHCSGTGKLTTTMNCTQCSGLGHEKCGRCGGDGRMLDFQIVTYSYQCSTGAATILPHKVKRDAIQRAVEEAFKNPNRHFVLPGLTKEQVNAHLHFDSNDVDFTVEHARAEMDHLERVAASEHGPIFFKVEYQRVTPISYVNARVGSRYGQFWAVGRRHSHDCVLPPIPTDFAKACTWLSLLATVMLSGLTYLFPGPLTVRACIAVGVATVLFTLIAAVRHLSVKRDQLVTILGGDISDKARLFALIGEMLSAQKHAVFEDECHDQIFQMLMSDDHDSDLSASYRLMLTGQNRRRRQGVRILVLPEMELTHMDARVQRVLAASSTLILNTSRDPSGDDACFSHVLFELYVAKAAPRIVLRMRAEQELAKVLPKTAEQLKRFRHIVEPMDIETTVERFTNQQTTQDDVTATIRLLTSVTGG